MKILLWTAIALLLVVIAGLLGLSWIISNRFLVPAPYGLMPEFHLLDVEGAGDQDYLVTLPLIESPNQFAQVDKEGVYNLLWEGGYGRLGGIEYRGNGQLARRVSSVVGEPPVAGLPARLDVTVYRRNPLADHGIPFEELELQGEAGDLYAWWVPGEGKRAVLALHGRRRADRTETLRVMPVLIEAGWSVMALAYRNHDRSDPSPDGFFHYGQTEAEDARAAVNELSDRGVEEVVLFGYSMGGAVALETAKHWPEPAPRLAGIILDSPLLDPSTVIRHNASRNNPPIPTPIANLGLWVGSLRAGIDWQALDQRRSAGQIQVPILLIAGTADSTIPIRLVDQFASELQSPLEYLRLEGVEHVEGWNRQRQMYEESVARFLAELPAASNGP